MLADGTHAGSALDLQHQWRIVIKHLAYFEALANTEEDSSAWKEGQAGLVVLRLVDTWFEQGPRPQGQDLFGVPAIRACIALIDPGKPVRGILSSIVDALEATRVPDANAVNARLLAYGQALEYDAQWRLASDVYETVMEYADPREDSESLVLALLRSGYCLLMLDEVNASSESYRVAEQVSEAVGDVRGGLRARIGQAKLAIHRGNLPAAELMLDAVIEAAGALPAVQSLALHDRAHVAGQRGEHEVSIQLLHRALESAGAPRDRDRILGDIAMMFFTLGFRAAARDAYLVLAATAQEQFVRWASIMSLMSIAAADGALAAFSAYKGELEEAPLPPALAAEFALEVGKGLQRVSDGADAGTWLERALRISQEHGLNQWVFAAEAALASFATRRIEPVPASTGVSSSVFGNVAEAIRDMRATVVAAR